MTSLADYILNVIPLTNPVKITMQTLRNCYSHTRGWHNSNQGGVIQRKQKGSRHAAYSSEWNKFTGGTIVAQNSAPSHYQYFVNQFTLTAIHHDIEVKVNHWSETV